MDFMNIKSPTINKIIRITITIFIIPAAIISFFIITKYFARQEDAVRDEMNFELTSLESNFRKNYKLVDGLNLIVANDYELLDFLTSHEVKTNRDYIDFINTKVREYERLEVMFQNIINFKIYTGNENVLPILPFFNKLQYVYKIKPRKDFSIVNDNLNLNIFQEIFFDPENVYLDINVDIDRLLGVDKLENMYIINKGSIYGINDEEVKKMAETINFDSLKKEGGVLEKNNNIYMYTYLYSIDSYLVIERDMRGIKRNKYMFLFYTIFISITVLFSIFLVLKYLMYRILNQLDRVITTVKDIEKGNFDVEVPISDDDNEFNILANQINSMSSKISELIDEVVDKETSVLEAQLRAFQAQINAHFLQNTLEAIKMTALLDGNHDISKAITNLGHLLRYSMSWNTPGVELKDEIEYIRKYIDLYTMRIDNEIDFQVNIQDKLENYHIPKMCIQPLVENSMEHGILPADKDGVIKVDAFEENEKIIISVFDNGLGYDKDKEKDEIGKVKSIGLKNIETRLKLFFNNKVTVNIESEKEKFTLVKIVIGK